MNPNIWLLIIGVSMLIMANILLRSRRRLSVWLFVIGTGIGIAGFVGYILNG